MREKTKKQLAYTVCIPILVIACLYVGHRIIRAYLIEHNKAFAYSWISKVSDAESAYYVKYRKYGSLIDLFNAGLLEKEWTQTSELPFRFEVVITEKGYEASVVPIADNMPYTSYFVNELGIIKRDSR